MDHIDKSLIITGILVIGSFFLFGIIGFYFLDVVVLTFSLLLYLGQFMLTLPSIQRQVEEYLRSREQQVKSV